MNEKKQKLRMMNHNIDVHDLSTKIRYTVKSWISDPIVYSTSIHLISNILGSNGFY